MRLDDVDAGQELCGAAFLESDRALARVGETEPRPRSEQQAENWRRHARHFLATDPQGSWVAEHDGDLVGIAMSFRRDLSWFLATFAVQPTLQGMGVGTALLKAALDSGRGALRAMFTSSEDPRATRLYKSLGFDLHPQLELRGVLERSAIPVLDRVREGTASDFDLVDSLDRRLREARRGPDVEVLAATGRLLVVDRPSAQGYVWVEPHRTLGLGATDRRTATELLWAALAASEPGCMVAVEGATGANQWALDVAVAARLGFTHDGYLALRGLKPPAPYLHHGVFG